MIKFNLDKIMFNRDKMKVPKLHELSGVNKNTLYAMYKGTITRIDVSVIDRICTALDCSPGDLMKHIPDVK